MSDADSQPTQAPAPPATATPALAPYTLPPPSPDLTSGGTRGGGDRVQRR